VPTVRVTKDSSGGRARRKGKVVAGRTILIAVNDVRLRNRLVAQLEVDGEFVPVASGSIADAAEKFAAQNMLYDTVLLDVTLPDGSVNDFCISLREAGATMPIIMFGPRTEAKIVRALDSGASDYMVSPFPLSELLARLRAQARMYELIIPQRPPTKRQLLRQLDLVEAALHRIEPHQGGIGHNNPPDQTHQTNPFTFVEHQRAIGAVDDLRNEFKARSSDRSRVMEAGSTLAWVMGKMGIWLKKRANVASDQFAKSFGQAAGTTTALLLTGAFARLVSDAHNQVDNLIRMVGEWIGRG
jgi:DNA-binding response OmpR family regulator